MTKITKARLNEGKWLNISISVNNETKFGNNCGVYENQTKEEREAKVDKVYLGNVKIVWTNGTNVDAAPRDNVQDGKALAKVLIVEDDLPF